MSDTVSREEFEALRNEFNKFKKGSAPEKKKRASREPSKYNLFIKDEIAKLKSKYGKTKNHKEIFAEAVQAWTKQNPKTK